MMRFSLVVALAVSLSVVGTTGAQFFKYTDKLGNTRFTDDINQVPENQRSKVRRYAEAQDPRPPVSEPDESVSTLPGQSPTARESSTLALNSGPGDRESLEAAKARIEAMKKKLDADYQALLREKEILSKEKEGRQTREEIIEYNRRVEAFNQHAAGYDDQSDALHKMADEYNARVIETNSKARPSNIKPANP